MLLLLLAACVSEPTPTLAAVVAPEPVAVPAPPPPRWPRPGAPLVVLDTPLPTGWHDRRILLDAGHGAPGNPGATSVRCESEREFTRRTADAVAPLIGPGFVVERTRTSDAEVPYADRLRRAEAWPADALVGLHFDARQGTNLRTDPVTGCLASDDAWGFAVLWSDEGPAERTGRRRRLAEAIAARMVEAGFPAYDGTDYGTYAGDPDHPGVFVDRHAPGKRVMMLRRPTVPTVIVETHQSFDRDEVERWDEPATHAAFAGALRAAWIDVL